MGGPKDFPKIWTGGAKRFLGTKKYPFPGGFSRKFWSLPKILSAYLRLAFLSSDAERAEIVLVVLFFSLLRLRSCYALLPSDGYVNVNVYLTLFKVRLCNELRYPHTAIWRHMCRKVFYRLCQSHTTKCHFKLGLTRRIYQWNVDVKKTMSNKMC